MHISPRRRSIVLVALLGLACGKDGPVEPVGGDFSLGQSVSLGTGRDATVLGGAGGGEFAAVVVNTSSDSAGSSSFTLRGQGIATAPPAAAASIDGLKPSAPLAWMGGAADRPGRDGQFEARLRERERALTPRFAAARQWHAARVPAIPTVPSVGSVVRINVNPTDACTNPTYRGARVMAVGTKALILADTLNPPNGFSTADFQRFAARFDTLVYPMATAAFGEPTDIDGNGHIAIVFTRAVNQLTPFLANSFVGGLTFSRDLFPQAGSARAEACASSNEGEYFYLLAPDPTGSINGNRRSRGFVDTTTTGVIAHELVHLINSSRKLYVHTSAPSFEEKWLDEGLAHVGEELLFYRESGLAPRTNLGQSALTATARARNAFLADMSGNAGRYHLHLQKAASSSPYAVGDSLATRGAAWSFLRYLADRNASSDADVWSKLVNNTSVGIANLRSVFGSNVEALLRDWSVSLAVDDLIATDGSLQQKSWNWRQIFSGPSGSADTYPLQLAPMTAGAAHTGTVVAGGASYFKFSVPPEGSATLTLSAPPGATASPLQLVIVRTR